MTNPHGKRRGTRYMFSKGYKKNGMVFYFPILSDKLKKYVCKYFLSVSKLHEHIKAMLSFYWATFYNVCLEFCALATNLL